MCGRLNVVDCPEVIDLCEVLGISLKEKQLRIKRFISAASVVSIVLEKDGRREVQDAVWWLLLDKTDTSFKPSSYTSFNTRYDKLNVPGSAGYYSYRRRRCIVPAIGFGETEKVNGKPKYYDFKADVGIAFGGLYREWIHPLTGELTYSCSIITVPPHPKLKPYHSNTSPLMIPESHYNAWLSAHTDIADLKSLLGACLRVNLQGVEVKSPSQPEPVGTEFYLFSDIA